MPAAVCQAAENEDRFVADLPIRCHARTALVREQERHGKGGETLAPDALLWETPRLKD